MMIPSRSGKSLFQRWQVLDFMFYCCTLLLKSSDSWLSHLIRCVELLTYTKQGEKTEGSLTLSFISRASFTKQMQTSTQSPNFDLPFTSGPTSERCWIFCSLFPWLVYANQATLPVPSVFLFECCLEGKPCACPWGRVSAFLPDTPDSGGMAACAKDAPSKPDTKFLKWFVVQDLPSLWRQLLIGDALTEAMLISSSFCLQCFSPFFLALACLMPLLPSLWSTPECFAVMKICG